MNSNHDCVCVPCSYHVALESLLAGAKAEIARLTTKLQPAFDQPAPDGTLLCAICDQSEARGHAPDCPGPNWPRLYISWLNDKRNTAESALTAERQKVAALGDVCPGDVIRYPLYIMGREYDHEERTVEVFRGCLGVFRSGNDRTAGVFTPLCDLYKPAPDSTKGYIPNYGEYQTSFVPLFTVVKRAAEGPALGLAAEASR